MKNFLPIALIILVSASCIALADSRMPANSNTDTGHWLPILSFAGGDFFINTASITENNQKINFSARLFPRPQNELSVMSQEERKTIGESKNFEQGFQKAYGIPLKMVEINSTIDCQAKLQKENTVSVFAPTSIDLFMKLPSPTAFHALDYIGKSMYSHLCEHLPFPEYPPVKTANWNYITENPNGKEFLDTLSVKRLGEDVQFWIKAVPNAKGREVYKSVTGYDAAYIMEQQIIYCDGQDIKGITHADFMNSGEVITFGGLPESSFKPIELPTDKALFKMLCSTPKTVTSQIKTENRKSAELSPLLPIDKRVFTTKDHPKSRGISLSLVYPANWKPSEDPEPTMVQRFVKDDTDNIIRACILNIREIPDELKYQPLALLLSDNALLRSIPKNATAILSAQKKFSGLPGAWITYSQEIPTDGIPGIMYMYKQTMLYRDSIVTLNCGTGGGSAEKNVVATVFNDELPLYEAIGDSIAFPTTPQSFVNADFKRYVKGLQTKVHENWKPPEGKASNTVKTVFTVGLNGELVRSRIIKSSDLPEFDKAALEAIRSAAPFDPLPQAYEQNSVDVDFSFDYVVKAKSL